MRVFAAVTLLAVSSFAHSQEIGAPVQCVPEGPRVALTFDDGPHPSRTLDLLNTLRTYNVPATFFMLGQRVVQYPEIARMVASDGHEIGIHTFNHPDLFKVSAQERENQIVRTWNALQQVLPDVPVRYWRAPYGNLPKQPIVATHDLGLKHVGWTIDTLDWTKESAEVWRQRVNYKLQPSGRQIILMHDHAAVSGHELENLIVSLRHSGYHLVSLSMFDWPTCPVQIFANHSDVAPPAEETLEQLPDPDTEHTL